MAIRSLRSGTVPWAVCVAGLLLSGRSTTVAQQEAPEPAIRPSTLPAPVDYQQVISDLDSDIPARRREASLRLNSMDGNALPFVRKALAEEDASPEATIRLTRALPYLEARARQEQRSKESKAYLSAAWEEAYRKGGSTDPKWDNIALDAIYQFRVQTFEATHDRQRLIDLFRQAYDLGCRNDLMLVTYRQVVGRDSHLLPSDIQQKGITLEKYLKSDVPGAVRIMLSTRLLQRDFLVSAHFWTAPAIDAVGDVMADKAAPVWLSDELAGAHLRAIATAEAGDRNQASDQFLRAYRDLQPLDRPGRHLNLAEHAVQMAWKARGNGSAGMVTPQGWKGFSQWLAVAQEHIEAGWKLDPEDPRLPALMITVCMGSSDDRQLMETWYQRAMKAYPDYYAAAQRKLYYLYPRWRGSHEAMIEFGRECLATENWRGGIPFILLDAHEAVSRERADENHLARPETWNDLQRVFEGHLLNTPSDVYRRSQFARLATRAEKWGVADEQFKVLGDNADFSFFGGKSSYDHYRRKAARLARTSPATHAQD